MEIGLVKDGFAFPQRNCTLISQDFFAQKAVIFICVLVKCELCNVPFMRSALEKTHCALLAGISTQNKLKGSFVMKIFTENA